MKFVLFIILFLNISYAFSFQNTKSINSLGGYHLNESIKDFSPNKNRYINLNIIEDIFEFSHYDIQSKHIDIELNKKNLISSIYLSYNLNTNVYKILKIDLNTYINNIEKQYKIKFKKKILSLDKNNDEIEYYFKNNYIELKILFFSNLINVHNINIQLKNIVN